ncbi:MAG: hypothetical protein ABI605_05260 [Rhizobacter sp.]
MSYTRVASPSLVIHAVAHVVVIAVVMALVACGGGGGSDSASPPATAASASFALSVTPASLTVGPGEAARVEISLQRAAGFTDPVSVTLTQPPAGVTADTVLLSGTQTRAWLSIRLSADPVAGSVLKLPVTGTSGNASQGTSTTLTVGAPQPLAQARIAAALDAGTLDYGSSLLYRAYALLGDKRLPDAYLGSGSAEEDNALFDEITLRFAGLPAAVQDTLRPFIVRPADPLSAWNAGATASAMGTLQRAHTLNAKRADLPATTCAASSVASSWISQRSASYPVRVWAQCHGDSGYDAESSTQIGRTLAVLDKVYPSMTAVMGPPLPDLEGGDNAIDFYLVDEGGYVNRREENFRPLGLGSTYSDYAETPTGKAHSAFVTMPRSVVYTSRFHNTVIHEFFHVLQKAHNGEFANQAVAGKPNTYELHWFVEASAAWASAHFDRTAAPWEDGRGAYVDAHRRFTQYFLPSFDALNASGSPHDYSAYIWPYFVEQETGGTGFMTSIWSSLESVASFEAADKAIASAYPFDTHFKRFALKNLNTQFLPGDPLPRSDRYVSLDPAQFADDGKTPPITEASLVANQEFSHDLELKNLSARYLRLSVSNTSPQVRKVTVDLSGLQPASELDVQALVLTDDGWLPAPIDLQPGKAVFCFDKGPSTASLKGSFREIMLVVANHALAKGSDVSGTLKVQPKAEPCATLWEGTIQQVTRSVMSAGTITITTTANVSFEFDATAPAMAGELAFKLRAGTYTYDMLSDQPSRNPPCRGMTTGSGAMPLTPYLPFVPSGGSANLSIFPETLQYGGSGLSVVPLTSTDNCNDRNVDVTTVDPAAYVFWWTEHGVDTLSSDGNSIRRSYTSPEATYDIRLDKKTEGD